jgi:hypothetical protein
MAWEMVHDLDVYFDVPVSDENPFVPPITGWEPQEGDIELSPTVKSIAIHGMCFFFLTHHYFSLID